MPLRNKLLVGAAAAAAGTVAAAAAPVVLPALGFGASGVVAGSVAAAWHGTIGNVAAGSLFASLQSAGAAGLAVKTYAGIAVAAGTAGGTIGSLAGSVGSAVQNAATWIR